VAGLLYDVAKFVKNLHHTQHLGLPVRMRDGIDFLVIQIELVIVIGIGIDLQPISISMRNQD